MKRILKLIALLIIGLFALLVAAAVALTVFIDPNDYRDEIAAFVEQQTGRPLTLEGELSLSLFPWIGFEAGPAELGNAPGFGDEPFARVEEVGVKVELLPLLRRELVMDTVILQGLVLNLARDEEGNVNWEGLAGEAEATPDEPAPEPSPRGGLAGFAVSGVKVSDARIAWEDRQAGTHVILQELDLTTGALGGAEPVEVALEFDLLERPDAQPRHFAMTSQVRLDLQDGTLSTTDLVATFAGLELTGEIQGRDLLAEPRFEGHIALAEFVPRRLLQDLGIEVPPTADPTVLGKAALQLQFNATTTAAELDELVLGLDDTTVRGMVAVPDIEAQVIRFDLDVDRIDLDRYLPPQPSEAAADGGLFPAAQAAPPEEEAPLLPVELIRELNVAGELRIGELKAYNLRTAQVRLVVAAQDGAVRVHPAEAQLYGGRYSGDVRIDATGAAPVLSMNETLEGVQAQPLLHDAAESDLLSGIAQVSAQLTGRATTMEELRRTLNGTITMAFREGAVKGINIPYMIRKANAAIRGQPAPPEEPQQTDFTELTASAAVRDGVIDNQDLELQSPLLRVTGAGTANLVQETLDYTAKAVIVASLEGQGGEALEALRGVPIPVRIEGPFADPGFKVDLAQVITEQQKQQLEQKVEEKKGELRERLEEKLKDRLPGGLDGLLKR